MTHFHPWVRSKINNLIVAHWSCSGKILHIDFGDCFEASMNREKFPEKVCVLVFNFFADRSLLTYGIYGISFMVYPLTWSWQCRFPSGWLECLWKLWRLAVSKATSSWRVKMWWRFFEQIRIVSWLWWRYRNRTSSVLDVFQWHLLWTTFNHITCTVNQNLKSMGSTLYVLCKI